ncbi:MAG: bifunctional [glutamate--ammonia ligase]-adenylyl-L-tyrosine phosphorylase/[glutamate--ammonia-ligase] adenylyltransferase, partial [Desulfobacula sp.]|nr:bifunctional [glutamate--ammonia ligase]-adenylyl-L-tyrosine phosphorylase/[glutamate--ammonia-ligase] adenylyltransferase [Desulfobacula sp.]
LKSIEKANFEINLKSDQHRDLSNILLFSEFIASSFIRKPQIFYDLIKSNDLCKSYSQHTYITRLEKNVSKDMDITELKATLLQIKLYEMIRIAWRDLTTKAELEETLDDISNLADAILDTAMTFIYDENCKNYGIPVDKEGNFQRIIVLGMGKLGARELNFSSDIDLIFVYPEGGYTNGKNIISNEEFFTKLCRMFLKFFSSIAQEINFYRIDTRLRPYGDGGPLVMSSAGFEEYYQAQGREWERYAMIKARPVAGDIEAGFKLLKTMNSFIYRRYFDYGSFDSFRDMKHRITLQVKSKKFKNNIKLGAGGIREIEFFGQLFQLIRGGVEPKLQERKILKVLDLLQTHNCIDESTKQDLKESYKFLRLVENRLQIYGDLQTHDIPEKDDQKMILALSMGYKSWNNFNNDLNDHMQRVHNHFNQLLLSKEKEEPDREIYDLKELWDNINDPQFMADPKIIGRFKDPDRILSVLRSLEAHPNTKRLTLNGRKKLARLIPILIKTIGGQKDPDAILSKLIDLIVTIERRTCYLSLLIENQSAL